MKQYFENKDGSVTDGDFTFPASEGNMRYLAMSRLIDSGEAELVAYVPNLVAEAETAERVWRDAELETADKELAKVLDGNGKARGLEQDWRTYRNQLRDWPDHPKYPDENFRPTFISTKGGPS